MTQPTVANPAEQQLLTEYTTYDQHVDVISALEWLFTDPSVKGLPATVVHFERFPRIRMQGKKDPLTPDFTVLFDDESAIIGEIAKIALHDNSTEKLCRQIGNYAALTAAPDGSGGLTPVQHLDVMQIVDFRNGRTAVRRIINERLQMPEHTYKPPHPPCIVQFARDETAYTFQRIADQDNGTLFSGARDPHIGHYLDGDLTIRAEHFVRTKARRAFINDPIKPLYLATHLWTRTWPTQHGRAGGDIVVNPQEVATLLRQQYDVGSVSEVREALVLLQRAGLATLQSDKKWKIAYRLLGRVGERDVHRIIAHRAVVGPQASGRRGRRVLPVDEGDTLF